MMAMACVQRGSGAPCFRRLVAGPVGPDGASSERSGGDDGGDQSVADRQPGRCLESCGIGQVVAAASSSATELLHGGRRGAGAMARRKKMYRCMRFVIHHRDSPRSDRVAPIMTEANR
jgi:hypothetical protein